MAGQPRAPAPPCLLDNAKIHYVAAFQARLVVWEEQDLNIFYLPVYSPHLNKIETLWRKIKYSWLRSEAYCTFKILKISIWHILNLFD